MKTGVVDTVIDGDTFTLETGETIRLANVDALEKDTQDAARARNALNQLIGGKNITYDVKAKDPYGRLLAEVWINGSNVNDNMIRFIAGL